MRNITTNPLRKSIQLALVALATGFSVQQAQAAGFALNDHSATASGNALAGAAASRADISFSFWNPALFSNAKNAELYVSGAIVVPKMDVTVNSATDRAGNNLTGEAPDDVVNTTLVPSVYFAYPVSDKTTLGAAFNAPFGLSGKYGEQWAGRYHSAETAVQDLALSASIAHQLTKSFTLGASVQVHKGSVLLAASLPDFAGGASAQGDAYGELEADDISYAYAVGLLYEPVSGTRLGAGYRSKVEYTFEGDGSYRNLNPTLSALGIDNAYLYDELSFPSVMTLSAEHDLNDRLTLGATAMKTGWKALQKMDIAFAPGADGVKQDNTQLTFGFSDQWFYSLGGSYRVSPQLTLRTGIAVDNSPATDQFRSARTPDGDRRWLSFGGSYQMGAAGEITAAYTYVDIDDVTVNRDGTLPEDSGRGALNADYETQANVFSLAYSTSF